MARRYRQERLRKATKPPCMEYCPKICSKMVWNLYSEQPCIAWNTIYCHPEDLYPQGVPFRIQVAIFSQRQTHSLSPSIWISLFWAIRLGLLDWFWAPKNHRLKLDLFCGNPLGHLRSRATVASSMSAAPPSARSFSTAAWQSGATNGMGVGSNDQQKWTMTTGTTPMWMDSQDLFFCL